MQWSSRKKKEDLELPLSLEGLKIALRAVVAILVVEMGGVWKEEVEDEEGSECWEFRKFIRITVSDNYLSVHNFYKIN